MISIRVMNIEDYDGIYDLWINTPGMELNTTDDSREGIAKEFRAEDAPYGNGMLIYKKVC